MLVVNQVMYAIAVDKNRQRNWDGVKAYVKLAD